MQSLFFSTTLILLLFFGSLSTVPPYIFNNFKYFIIIGELMRGKNSAELFETHIIPPGEGGVNAFHFSRRAASSIKRQQMVEAPRSCKTEPCIKPVVPQREPWIIASVYGHNAPL